MTDSDNDDEDDYLVTHSPAIIELKEYQHL